ncbi:MAG TPA: PH domain-containing protein [Longimicrobiales bacterium]|nr:PH domain-containing protein [Longimicrobiales bacterium]
MTRSENVLLEPGTSPNAVKYQVLSTVAVSVGSIIGIPLLLFVVPISLWYWPRYYAHLRMVLTTRDLKVSRGIMNREEKSIPLEKITDLAVYQGPIMRWLGLKGIRVETAGQSDAGSALVKVVGLDGVDAFRDRVLSQRDRITDGDQGALASASTVDRAPSGPDPASAELLAEIRDALLRIEDALKQP